MVGVIRVHAFLNGISPKVNIARLKFGLAYRGTVQYVSDYIRGYRLLFEKLVPFFVFPPLDWLRRDFLPEISYSQKLIYHGLRGGILAPDVVSMFGLIS